MKVLATPRSFGKNNPELFDILRDAGLDVVRNDTGGILSADRTLSRPEHRGLRELRRRYSGREEIDFSMIS